MGFKAPSRDERRSGAWLCLSQQVGDRGGSSKHVSLLYRSCPANHASDEVSPLAVSREGATVRLYILILRLAHALYASRLATVSFELVPCRCIDYLSLC